jgi:phage terminase large subunit-like protein
LSRINDLSCATIASKDDDGNIHVKCYSFTPLTGISDRANRDRVPYPEWVKSGHIYAPHGRTLDYDQIAQFLKNEFEKEGIGITSIHFDRWEAKDFFSACDRVGFAMGATRHEVGQGFVGISPRIKAMETALLQVKIRHGNNQPVLNLGASSAIIVSDPSGNRKIDKSKSSQKIDGVVSMMMAVYPLIAMIDKPVDVSAMIG